MIDTIKQLFFQVLDVLQSIGNGIVSLVEYVITLVQDIYFIVAYIGKLALSNIDSWFAWMPPICSAAIIGCISIAVIYKIIGRE